MPIVLTQNEATESGHTYADVLGRHYEYPLRYRNLIRPGERFVYYRGRRTRSGGTRPQVYLGSGVIGPTRPSGLEGRLVCDIEDYVPFPSSVPFKDAGGYLEPGAMSYAKVGLFFRTGVRAIDEASFLRILQLGGAEDAPDAPERPDGGLYASPENAELIDTVAMDVAANRLRTDWPGHDVTAMPHNNPGYDIAVSHQGDLVRYVEVKGTRKSIPEYFVSEGQRLFAERNSDKFTLLVVYGIDLEERTGIVVVRDGDIGASSDLRPEKWIGLVKGVDPLS